MYLLFLDQTRLSGTNHLLQFNIAFVGKSVPTYVLSTYVARLGMNYDGTLGGILCVNHANSQNSSILNIAISHVRNPLVLNALSGLTFRHRASSILGQALRCSPENAFYIFNQQIYFII